MTKIEEITKNVAAMRYGGSGIAHRPQDAFCDGAEWERNRDKWISVKEYLPGKGINKVLAQTGEWNGVQVVEFSEGEFMDYMGIEGSEKENITDCVTHWMPISIPEPPKEEEQC